MCHCIDFRHAEQQIFLLQLALQRVLEMKIVIADPNTGEEVPTTAQELVDLLLKANEWIGALEHLCDEMIRAYDVNHSSQWRNRFDNIKTKYET